jgi:Zn finger protein HypA/HybF involved in hydrogenase expression
VVHDRRLYDCPICQGVAKAEKISKHALLSCHECGKTTTAERVQATDECCPHCLTRRFELMDDE